MIKFFATLNILLSFFMLNAQLTPLQKYPMLQKNESVVLFNWRPIQDLKKNGLPRKAIDEILVLQKKAISDNNVVEFIHSFEELEGLISKARFDFKEEEKFIWNFSEQANKLTFPYKNLMQLEVAKWVNRLDYRGSLSMDDESLNWKIGNQSFVFKNENIQEYYSTLVHSILEQTEAMMSIDISALATLEKLNDKPVSVFEYIAEKLLNSSIISNEGTKEIRDANYYNTISTLPFAKDDIKLQLYYLLESFTFSNKNYSTYSYWANERLAYVFENSSYDRVNDFDKEALLLEAYKKHESSIQLDAASARFSYLIASSYATDVVENYSWKNKEANLDNNYVLALKLIESALTKFPVNEFVEELTELKNFITAEELNFSFKTDVNQDEKSILTISYRNVKELVFKVYKIKNESNQEHHQNPLAKFELEEIDVKKIVFPVNEGHLPHDMDFILDELSEVGQYLFIAAPSEQKINEVLSSKDIYQLKQFDYKVVTVSNLNALTTIRDGKIHFIVRNAKNGNPIGNAKIIIKDKSTKETTIYTDKKGEAHSEINSSITYEITKGNDKLNSRAYFYGKDNFTQHKFHSFYLDRRIYKPGQLVQFKAIVYENDEVGKTLNNELVKIEVKDANRKVIFEKKYTTNEFGSIAGNFNLPLSGFLLGNLDVYMNDKYQSGFSVEKYKVPTFEVVLEDIAAEVKLGDSITIKGVVNAYAGYPISNANVEIEINQNNYFPRWCVVNYDMENIDEYQTVKTDSEGKFEFTFLPKKDNYLFGSHFNVNAIVTDLNGEVQSDRKSFFIGKERYEIDIDFPENILSSKENQYKVSVTNSQSVELTGKKVTYLLEKVVDKKWYTSEVEEAEFKEFTEKEFVKTFPNIRYYSTQQKPKVKVSSGELDENQFINLNNITNKIAGTYELTVSIIDPTGEKTVRKRTFSYINLDTKKGQHNSDFWAITSTTYPKKGDIVTFTLGSSYKKLNLYHEISYPNGTIKGEWIKLKKRKVIEVEVDEAAAKGFKISFYSIKDQVVFQESFNIEVKNEDDVLLIQLKSERDFLKPGSKETWNISLTNQGNPFQNSEVLVSMYDKALDQFVTNDWNTNFYKNGKRTNPWSTVYAERTSINYNGWQNEHYISSRSFDYLMESDNVEYKMESMSNSSPSLQKSIAFTPPVVSDEIVEQASSVQPRTNFAETAFFYPQLISNEKGETTFSFTTPDVLTTWKFRAFVHSQDLKKGSITKEFIAKKELLVQPNAPRFYREEDEFIFSSKVVNTSDKDQVVEVSLMFKNPSDDANVSSDFGRFEKKTITLKANATEVVEWSGKVPTGKHDMVAYYISAKGVEFEDAEQRLIPILSNRVLITSSLPFVYNSTAEKTISAAKILDLQTTATPVKLQLEIQSQPLWSSLLSLPSLISDRKSVDAIFSNYYAANVAQKIIAENPIFKKTIEVWTAMNPTVFQSELEKNEALKELILAETPWVLDAQSETEKRMKIVQLFDASNLDTEINQSLLKLKTLQQADGGWGWYDTERSNVYITQNIVLGFANMKAIGINVDEHVTSKALEYLEQHYETSYSKLTKEAKAKKQSYSDMSAQWLFIRSQFNAPKTEASAYYNLCIKENWTRYNLHIQSLIGLTALKQKDTTFALKIKASLEDRSTTNPMIGMYWNSNKQGYNWNESVIETQSALIQFFAQFEGTSTQVSAMKLFLLQQKQANSWNSARSTTAACYALLLGESGKLPMQTTAVIGKNEFNGKIVEGVNNSFIWTVNDINKDKTQLTLSKNSEGTVFGAYYLQYLEDLEKVKKSNEDIRIEKHYYVIKEGKEVELKSNETVALGTKITVKMTIVSNRSMQFIHVKDSKALGCEATKTLSGLQWNGLGYFIIQNDASTSFFIDNLPKGNNTIEHSFYATSKGKIHFGPSIVECELMPSLRANSNGFVLNVE